MTHRYHHRTIKWNVAFRYINILLAFTQGLLLVPLYLRYIPIELYGYWLVTGNILAWISTVDPGLTIVMNQQVSTNYGKRDFEEVGKLIGSGLLLSFVVLICALSFGLLSSYFIIDVLNPSNHVYDLIIINAFNYAFVGASLMLFSFGISSINYGLQGSLSVGLINTLTIFISVLLTVILLTYGYGLMAIPYSLIFSGGSLAILNLCYLFLRLYNEKITISISISSFKHLSKLLGVTFFSRVVGIITNNIDLVLISKFIGPEIITAYSMSKKPIDISKEFVNQPVVGYQSVISHMVGSFEWDKLRSMLSGLIIILVWLTVFVTGGVISFNSEFVSLWVGHRFYIGSSFNLLLCVGAGLAIFTQSAGYFSISLGDLKRSSVAGAVQSLLYLFLVYFSLKYYGLYALVLTPIITMLMTTTWFYFYSVQSRVKFSLWEVKQFINQFLYSLLSVVLTIAVFLIADIDIKDWLDFSVNILLFTVIFTAFLFLFSRLFRDKTKEIYYKLRL